MNALALTIDVASGLMPAARVCLSPNRDARPAHGGLDLLVIHGISLPPGEFGGPYIEQLFLNQLEPSAHAYFATLQGLQVSSHLLIRRDGSLVQFVPFHERAWHAGVSQWRGRVACNDYSIGIELEGTDDQPYTDAQYVSLNHAVQALRATYPSLGAAEVVGHSDIAPQRKTDPGNSFDWARVR
jgi:N-acetyl-anhydromuramoyl-L-alanine amidase